MWLHNCSYVHGVHWPYFLPHWTLSGRTFVRNHHATSSTARAQPHPSETSVWGRKSERLWPFTTRQAGHRKELLTLASTNRLSVDLYRRRGKQATQKTYPDTVNDFVHGIVNVLGFRPRNYFKEPQNWCYTWHLILYRTGSGLGGF